ncbi:MAG: hypothetical protein DRN08_02350 [Thermoplasmata archaeon]|nr:MAG: hypothetical protein DRN05_02705 [Thermoplasmata archaeon]RLF35849.1 MAG: hypothetical protein DRN08_02350 [Thermoplasmata archaeon]
MYNKSFINIKTKNSDKETNNGEKTGYEIHAERNKTSLHKTITPRCAISTFYTQGIHIKTSRIRGNKTSKSFIIQTLRLKEPVKIKKTIFFLKKVFDFFGGIQ